MGRRRANPPPVDPEERILELLDEGDEAAYAVAYDQALEAGLTEHVVRFELAKALSYDPNDLEFEDDDWYGHETYKVAIGKHHEYRVVASDDVGEAIAIADVTQQLESEPGNFNEDFVRQHIDDAKLKAHVRTMVMEDEYVDELARNEPEEFWLLAQRERVSVPDLVDDDGEPTEPDEEYIEAVKEKLARQAERDPEGYLENLGVENLLEYALEQGIGIDVKAAAAEAVATDGWQHFLCGYDGNSYSLPSGHVYWREN